jgi:pimeloyl-ACP methyl ester carboxylesterase
MIAWSELGDGPPLVLIHGLGDSNRTWRSVAPLLAARFRLFMVDLPGHGLSERPDAPYTLSWYADTIAAWMDAVGLRRAHVCGHSLGGGIAQWMLLGHRARVDRLALVSAGGLGREVGTALRLATLPIAAPFFESPPLFGSGTKLFMQWASRSFARREKHDIQEMARLNAMPKSGRAFRRTVRSCIGLMGQRVQTWQRIHEVESLPPLAVFWGARDAVLPVHHAHETARRLTNVTVAVYPRCGHFVHLEIPEQLASDIVRFFEQPGRDAARIHRSPQMAFEPGQYGSRQTHRPRSFFFWHDHCERIGA